MCFGERYKQASTENVVGIVILMGHGGGDLFQEFSCHTAIERVPSLTLLATYAGQYKEIIYTYLFPKGQNLRKFNQNHKRLILNISSIFDRTL